MVSYSVIDGDGHVREAMPAIAKLMGPLGKRRNLTTADAWDRQIQDTLGQKPASPREQLAAMDEDGIDVMVMYPTAGLGIGLIAEEHYAKALASAYNTWLHEFCQANPERLKMVALVAPQDLDAAVRELNRAVTELGAVAAMLPTHVPLRPERAHQTARWSSVGTGSTGSPVSAAGFSSCSMGASGR